MKIYKKKDRLRILGFLLFLLLIWIAFLPTHFLGASRYQKAVYGYLTDYINTNKTYPENEKMFLDYISTTVDETRNIKKDFKICYDIDFDSLSEKDGLIYDSNGKHIILIQLKFWSLLLKNKANMETNKIYKLLRNNQAGPASKPAT